jgi:hypothetical protein
VSELVFILTDFFAAVPSEPRAALPRLPALESLLARSRRAALATDWRAWLAARTASAAVRALTAAATVAAAWPESSTAQRQSGQYWLATPVHYFAGLDSVHLHPAGLLQLDADEQRQLSEDFARVFADSPWSLRGLGQRELLLWGPRGQAGADPARFAGSDPSAGLPRGADAATLRGLGAEIEMWLHEHALNHERARRGLLPVTALWLWGGGLPAASSMPASTAPLPRLYGRDTYAEALWRLRAAAAAPLPAQLDPAQLDARADSVFLYPMMAPDGLSAAFAQFESRWLSRALGLLRAGGCSALQLLIGTRAYRLRRWDAGRFWRGRVPWWESLA